MTYILGTDATHAEHIETIKSRMYVGLTADQRFLPGELGMGLVEGQTVLSFLTLLLKTHMEYQLGPLMLLCIGYIRLQLCHWMVTDA